MTAEQFKDYLIGLAIASVEKHETREHRKRGCLRGLEICHSLHSLDDFLGEIQSRHEMERGLIAGMRGGSITKEEYWEFRCATAQLEFMLERMRGILSSGVLRKMA